MSARLACGNAHSQPIGTSVHLVNQDSGRRVSLPSPSIGAAWCGSIGRFPGTGGFLAAGLLLATLGCAARTTPPPTAADRPVLPAAPEATLRVGPGPGGSGPVEVVELESYVAGVVAAEQAVGTLPASVARGVVQVQAVISRTFALAHRGRHGREGFDVCRDTHCQLYRPATAGFVASALGAAVRATRGQVLQYQNRPIDALFHANCGGHTSAADAIWGGEKQPYLTSVSDEFCSRNPAAAWSFTIDRSRLRELVNRDGLTDVGTRLDGLTVVQRDAGGRAVLIAIDGERSPLVRGEELRRVIVQGLGPRSMRSLNFDVQRRGDILLFSGRGFGHGAGLCQAGALERLRLGATPAEVLAYYYPGARLGGPPLGPDTRKLVSPVEALAGMMRSDTFAQ